MNGISARRPLMIFGLLVSALTLSGFNSAYAAEPDSTANAGSSTNADVGSLIQFSVEKYKLENGLTVLLHEDHSAPLISYQTWFKVGSKNEEPGLTGIAHLFEHMMFTGSKKYSGDQFDSILQLNGATNNAFTTHDYTGYYENLPNNKLELVMDIESDRMQNLMITPEKLKSEREVVKEERRMRVDNSPFGVLRETLYQSAFRVHPYRWPVIGYMVDIDNISLEKAQAFYKTYYAPNNAVLVLSGDFEVANVKKMIAKYYSGISAQPIPAAQIAPEPAQNGQRIQGVERPVQNTTFAIGYHVPAAGEDDTYALDLLANILGHGSSSRLFNRLVYKEQMATGVNVSNSSLQNPGLFEIFVSLKPQANYDKAAKAVLGEMWRPRNLLVSNIELETAKKQVMKGYVEGLKTIAGKAELLELNEILFSDYSQLFKDLNRYSKVTAQDIKRVAEKYLTSERSTIAVLRPAAQKHTAQMPSTKSPPPKSAPGKAAHVTKKKGT